MTHNTETSSGEQYRIARGHGMLAERSFEPATSATSSAAPTKHLEYFNTDVRCCDVMSAFPAEIREYITSFITFNDRLQLRLVSKSYSAEYFRPEHYRTGYEKELIAEIIKNRNDFDVNGASPKHPELSTYFKDLRWHNRLEHKHFPQGIKEINSDLTHMEKVISYFPRREDFFNLPILHRSADSTDDNMGRFHCVMRPAKDLTAPMMRGYAKVNERPFLAAVVNVYNSNNLRNPFQRGYLVFTQELATAFAVNSDVPWAMCQSGPPPESYPPTQLNFFSTNRCQVKWVSMRDVETGKDLFTVQSVRALFSGAFAQSTSGHVAKLASAETIVACDYWI